MALYARILSIAEILDNREIFKKSISYYINNNINDVEIDILKSIEDGVIDLFQISNDIEIDKNKQLLTKYKKNKINELDTLISFSLMATFEAYLRRDYLVRGQFTTTHDTLSSEIVKLYNTKEERAKLEDEILFIWCTHAPSNGIKILSNELIRLFKYRHWIAHGRYWPPKLARQDYDFKYFENISEEFENYFMPCLVE